MIDAYHRLLDGPLGRETAEVFQAAVQRERLMFGERPICVVLRPLFLTRPEADAMARDAACLAGAFHKVLAAIEGDRALRAALRLSPEEEAVLGADRQPFAPDQIARLDGFLAHGGTFHAIEYNAESPGGIAFGDALIAIFRELPVMRAFSREHALSSSGGLANTLRQLLAAHAARLGAPPASPPAIAVVDWKSAPTRREFELCADFFTRNGYPSRVIEPDVLRIVDGRLVADDFAIDIVYKRVLVGDLVRRGGVDHPLVRAVRDGLVTSASRFQVHILFRKELFAFCHDERVAHAFSAAERDVVRRIVPWSRLVEDVAVEAGDGRRVRLPDLIRERRANLVLKPTDQYGGKGVVLGWLASPAEWEAALTAARTEPYLVQERVALRSERFPVLDGSGIRFADFYADINPYIWGGARSEGFGARLAPGELLNVTAGGGSAVPVFVVEG